MKSVAASNSYEAETKVLKQLVRDCIDPNKDLGHSDKHGKERQPEGAEADNKPEQAQQNGKREAQVKENLDGARCEDCV